MRRGGARKSEYFRKRGGAPYGRPRGFSPHGRERSREGLSYSPVRREHRPRQYEEDRLHFGSETLGQTHSAMEQYPSGYVETGPPPPQHPGHPQLSSNPTTAAIEAGLLFITELAKTAAFVPGVPDSRLGNIHQGSLEQHNHPLPALMDCAFGGGHEVESRIDMDRREVFLSHNDSELDNQRLPGVFTLGSSDLRSDTAHVQREVALQSDVPRYGMRRDEAHIEYRHPDGRNGGTGERAFGSNSDYNVIQDRFEGPGLEERDRHGGYVDRDIGDHVHPEYRQVHSSMSDSSASPLRSGFGLHYSYGSQNSFESGLTSSRGPLEHLPTRNVNHEGSYLATEDPFPRPLISGSLELDSRSEIGNVNEFPDRVQGEVGVYEHSRVGIERAQGAYNANNSNRHAHSDIVFGRKRKPSGVTPSFVKKRKSDLKQHQSHPRSKFSTHKKVSVQKRLGPQPLKTPEASAELQRDNDLAGNDLRSQLSNQLSKPNEGSLNIEKRLGSRNGHHLTQIDRPISARSSPMKQSWSTPNTSLQRKNSDQIPSKGDAQNSSPMKSPMGKSPQLSTSTLSDAPTKVIEPKSLSASTAFSSIGQSTMQRAQSSCSSASNERVHDGIDITRKSSSSFKDRKKVELGSPLPLVVPKVEVVDLGKVEVQNYSQLKQKKKQVYTAKSGASTEVLKVVSNEQTSPVTKKSGLGLNVSPHESIMSTTKKESSQGAIKKSIFPLLGKGDIKLPFSLPEQESESLPGNEGKVELDSDSEGDLIIDVTREAESPIGPKCTSLSSRASPLDDNIESLATFTFQDRIKTECEEIAEEVLDIDLVSQMKKCVPDPLCILYDSISVVLGCINRWEVSVPIVKEAFGSYALSVAEQPWRLTSLFKLELDNLRQSCFRDLKKWKNSVNVFRSISSSLCKQQELAQDVKDIQKHETFNSESEHSGGQCNLRHALGSVGEMNVDSNKTDGVDQNVDFDCEGSVCTDSNECNMSVCSTLSDGEIDTSAIKCAEIMKNESKNKEQHKMRDVSLSPGELTPTPPSTPVACGSLVSTTFPVSQFSSLKADVKVSGSHHNNSHVSMSGASTVSNSDVLISSTIPGSVTQLSTGGNFGKEMKSKNVIEPKKVTKASKVVGKPSKDGKSKEEGSRERKGSITKTLNEASKRNAAIRSSVRHDSDQSRHARERLHSSDGFSMSRRYSSSRGRSKRSHSPVLHSRRHSSPRPISRYKQGFSSSLVRRGQGDSKKRYRSGTPESKDVKRWGKDQQHSRKHALEDDDDIELLQLKKEVILSIVKKPEQGKSSSVKAISSSSKVCTVQSCTVISQQISDKSKQAVNMESATATRVSSSGAGLPSEADSQSALMDVSVPAKKSKVKKSKSPKIEKRAFQKSSTKSLPSSSGSSKVGSPEPISPVISSSTTNVPGFDGPLTSSMDINKAMSVMVYPGKESTWKIQPFQITSSGCDSDSEMGDHDIDADMSRTSVSEISSFLVEARKVASQASNMAKQQAIHTSPTPPASLPPERKKEYIDLKKRIALHEKNLKKKKLLQDSSRTSSPQFNQSLKEVEKDNQKLSTPVPAVVTSSEGSRQSSQLVEFRKQLQINRSQFEKFKVQEQQEQQNITKITNELTTCVFEIERHEQEMESMQNKLLNLQKLLEITGNALKDCERNMTDLTSRVRQAKLRKSEFTKFATESRAKIEKLEKKILELEPKHFRRTSQLLEVEPISDSEEVETNEGISGMPSTGKLGLAGGQDCSGKTEVQSMLNTQSEVEVTDSKHMSTDIDVASVSKEVVIKSSSCLNGSHTLLRDKPLKLHHILHMAMQNALPFPSRDSVPHSLVTPVDRTLLSTEVNMHPLVASVLSSLTQQSFDNALLGIRPDTEKFQDCSEECDEDESKVNTQLHACTENPFTLSRDDPPTLILPMVVEGNLNLGITEPSVSSVAMEAVNDGIVKSTGAEEGQVLTNESNNIGDSTNSTVPLENLPCSSSVQVTTISSLENKIYPDSGNTKPMIANKSSIAEKCSTTKSGSIHHPKDNPVMEGSFSLPQSVKSIHSIRSKTTSSSISVGKKNKSEGGVLEGKCIAALDIANKDEDFESSTLKVAGHGISVCSSSKEINISESVIKSTRPEKVTEKGTGDHQTEVKRSREGSDMTSKHDNIMCEEEREKAPKTQEELSSIVKKQAKRLDSSSMSRTKDNSSRIAATKSVSESAPASGCENKAELVMNGISSESGGVSIPLKSANSNKLDKSEFKRLLQIHADCVEDIKGKLAVSELKNHSSESSCARTFGRKASICSPPSKCLHSIDGNWIVAESTIKKMVSNYGQCPLPHNVGDLQEAVSNKTSLHFSVHEFLFSDGIICKESQATESVLSSDVLNSLPCGSTTASSTTAIFGRFTPYISPLLQFSSYRSSPNFSSSAKVPLSSVTYSNKLDPSKVMCQYELTGTCSDSNCTAQHFRDIQMTDQEICESLVLYCPSLMGITNQEVSGTSDSATAGKLSSFSEKFVKKYTGKVSNEDLWKILIHELNKERMKSTHKRGIVTFDCDSVLHQSNVDIPFSGHHQIGKSACHSFCILPKVNNKKRYFTMDRTIATETNSNAGTSNTYILSAQKLLDENNVQEAFITLEKGLEIDGSEEVWLEYLRLKALETTDADLDSLYGVFTKAIESTHSYTIMLETIGLSRCFASKLKMIESSIVVCRSFESATEVSHCCFELFINVILLHLMVGKLSGALKLFDNARRSGDGPSSTSNFSGLINILQREECILLCLCHLNVSYSGSLPMSIFAGDSYQSVPAKLSSHKFFAVSFNSTVELPPNGYKKMLRLSKYYLDFLHDSSLPSSQAVEKILPIFRNVILFETIHGSLHKAINILHKLSLLCPHFTDLWMMLARINELKRVDGCQILEKAVVSSPMKPELYYLAARLELSRCKNARGSEKCVGRSCSVECLGHSHHIDKAVEWLSRCVREFYVRSEADPSVPEVLTLYRKLLNQMIGYNQTVPPFAEDIDFLDLKERLCPLWLCYCLLVELAVVPSISNTGAELFHQSAEEAYESAIHSVQSPDDHKALWKEYIFYMREKSLDGSHDDFLKLVDCVQRCLMDVDITVAVNNVENAREAKNYSFHNEMLDLVTSRLPPSSVFKCEILQKVACKFPTNVKLVIKLVQCALQQQLPNISMAQTVLAEALAFNPESPELWKQAIEVETQLGHKKEARWMFNKALEVLPLHIQLWRDFFVFELKELLAESSLSTKSDPNVQDVLSVVRRAKRFGVDLLPILHSMAQRT